MEGLFGLEKKIYQWINLGWENSLFDNTLPWTEREIHFLIPLAVLLAFLFLLGSRKKRVFVIWAVVILGFSQGVNKVIKKTVRRTRPCYTYKTGEFRLHLIRAEDVPSRDEYSFPSGHTTFFFALATVVTFFVFRWWVGIAMYLLALVMGLSRVYVGVHYPLDILGGMVVGTSVPMVLLWLKTRIRDKQWYKTVLDKVTFTTEKPVENKGDSS